MVLIEIISSKKKNTLVQRRVANIIILHYYRRLTDEKLSTKSIGKVFGFRR